jgi:hypothetical protein
MYVAFSTLQCCLTVEALDEGHMRSSTWFGWLALGIAVYGAFWSHAHEDRAFIFLAWLGVTIRYDLAKMREESL